MLHIISHTQITSEQKINQRVNGGDSAAKEPGHFEVRTSSSQVTRMHFFPQKVDDLFLSSPSKHKGRQCCWDCFTVKI